VVRTVVVLQTLCQASHAFEGMEAPAGGISTDESVASRPGVIQPGLQIAIVNSPPEPLVIDNVEPLAIDRSLTSLPQRAPKKKAAAVDGDLLLELVDAPRLGNGFIPEPDIRRQRLPDRSQRTTATPPSPVD
jgi:hypothetical protein